MGMVYRAHHLALDERVAIKVLRRDVSARRGDRHAVPPRGAGRGPAEERARRADPRRRHARRRPALHGDGAPRGRRPRAARRRQRARSIPHAAVDLVLQACEAIAEAHALGIVHRDLKPTNLFVTRPDAVGDRQGARLRHLEVRRSAPDLSLTQTSSMLGSPAYMSPEQMRSARTRRRAHRHLVARPRALRAASRRACRSTAESFSELCVMVALDPPAPMRLRPGARRLIIALPGEAASITGTRTSPS